MTMALGLLAASCEEDPSTTINKETEDGTLSFSFFEPQNVQRTYYLTKKQKKAVVDNFYWNQPDYGTNIFTMYDIEASFTEDFATKAVVLERQSTQKVNITVADLNSAIITLYGDNVPVLMPIIDLYLRVVANPGVMDTNRPLPSLYSNAIKLSVQPFTSAAGAAPATFYLIGEAVGAWDNNKEALGNTLIPMSLVKDEEYDAKTGVGNFEFTGYFNAAKGFKAVSTVGSWDIQWGNGDADGIDNPVYCDGGSKNFMVSEAGFYTIKLCNLVGKEAVSIVKAEKQEYTEYESMQIAGDFTAIDLSKAKMAHIWYGEATFADDVEAQIKSGDKTWGNAEWFPFGLSDGTKIQVAAGEYTVVFNDVDGCYFFIEKE